MGDAAAVVRSNCPICNRPMVPDVDQGRGQHSARYWSLTHYESNHQDYLTWKKSKRNLSFGLGVIAAITVVVLLALLPRISGEAMPVSYTAREGGELASVLGVVVIFVSTLLVNQWGIRKFKREWIAKGGLPT